MAIRNTIAVLVGVFFVFCQIGFSMGRAPAPIHKSDPDYFLSGDLVKGGVWQLSIYCSHEGTPQEAMYGELLVDGKEMKDIKIGEIVEAKLGNLKYFGLEKNKSLKVTGWYFSEWPQECSYLPK